MKEEKLSINGEMHPLSGKLTIANALEEMGIQLDQTGVAVALNGEVVTRGNWSSVLIASGDHIEVVRPIQGGLK